VNDSPDQDTTLPSRGLSRRRFLGLLGATGAAGAVGLAAGAHFADPDDDASKSGAVIPFFGPHQAGITTPQQRHLLFASLDVTDRSAETLGALFRFWTGAAVAMTRGEPVAVPGDSRGIVWDTGEAVGLGPSRLTLTFGVGPSLFDAGDGGVPGLAVRRPEPLVELPAFETDELDPATSGGEICILACADDEQVAVHAVRELVRLGHGLVAMRWSRPGFVPGGRLGSTPRNLLGFKDGTANIGADEPDALDRFVWIGDEGPSWLREGTYAVVRRINLRLDAWDGARLSEQERVIGRFKASGAPLSGHAERDPLDLLATDANGDRVVPANAHVRLASPDSNGGQRLLRRPYSFVDGDGGQGNLSAGLFFVAFQRDPRTQFIPIQRRLAHADALNEYLRHTGSAIFAMFPGVPRGGALGAGLF
jgi:deferrochelatase/peroxidase EfeB